MKFIHIADVHFDRPFTVLDEKDLAGQRRLEQRNAFKKVIEYIKTNNIEYLFICGDLFEIEYVKKSTIEYINKLFEEVPNTKIFITPGNHDPYTKNSYYKTFEFSKNVRIFTSEIEKIEDEKVNIYGYGFEDFYMESKSIEDFEKLDREKINILITHADLDGTQNKDKRYNSIQKNMIQGLDFDYVALGHIHKPSYEDKITYSGSLISLGFDELGKHRYDSSEKLMKLQKKFL